MRGPRLLPRLLGGGEKSAQRRGAVRRVPREERPHLVDAHTRTFWSRGALSPATLVESDAPAPAAASGRAAVLVADHQRGAAGGALPRANPAFSEAVFVELMRAR